MLKTKKKMFKPITKGTGTEGDPELVRCLPVNPRREGTHGYASWEVLTTGMTFSEYLAAGGRRTDLVWDVARGNTKLVGGALPVAEPFGGKRATAPVRRTAEVRALDDSQVPHIRSASKSKGWTTRWIRRPVLVKVDLGTKLGTRTMAWQETVATIYVSPKGNEYVPAKATEKANLIIWDKRRMIGLPPIRLKRYHDSSVKRTLAREERAIKREQKATKARSRVKAQQKKQKKQKTHPSKKAV